MAAGRYRTNNTSSPHIALTRNSRLFSKCQFEYLPFLNFQTRTNTAHVWEPLRIEGPSLVRPVHPNRTRSLIAIISGFCFCWPRRWRPLAARFTTATRHIMPTNNVSFPLYFRTGFLLRAQAPLTFFKPRPCFCNFYRGAHL